MKLYVIKNIDTQEYYSHKKHIGNGMMETIFSPKLEQAKFYKNANVASNLIKKWYVSETLSRYEVEGYILINSEEYQWAVDELKLTQKGNK